MRPRLPFREVAAASGFGSVRRFNGQMRRVYDRTPSELRRLARQKASGDPECYRFRLSYRPPYDWEHVLAFLRGRATPGVELVSDSGYRRTIVIDGKPGSIGVAPAATATALDLSTSASPTRGCCSRWWSASRRMFDLGADPAVIAEHMGADALLRGALDLHPGIRVPGAWDGFELAVRAILGQQITVRAATTIAGRVAARCGSLVAAGEGLERLFPTPAQLANADSRRGGRHRLARPCDQGACQARGGRHDQLRRLCRSGFDGLGDQALPGIGDWTAEYIAMRAFGEPDAFPSGDLSSAAWRAASRRARWINGRRRGDHGVPTPSCCSGSRNNEDVGRSRRTKDAQPYPRDRTPCWSRRWSCVRCWQRRVRRRRTPGSSRFARTTSSPARGSGSTGCSSRSRCRC